MGEMFVEIMNRVRNLYVKEGGAFSEPITKADYPATFDAEAVAKRINGLFTRDVEIGGKTYKRGQCVPGFPNLKDDGSTTSMNWLYCGGYTEEAGNLAKRRDLTQTPMQAKIHLYPKFAWAWPMDRRILYNRASVDMNGKPYNPEKAVIEWKDGKWGGRRARRRSAAHGAKGRRVPLHHAHRGPFTALWPRSRGRPLPRAL